MNRNEYGQIIKPDFRAPQIEQDIYAETCHLIKLAVKAGKIDRAYDTISFDRKGRADGSAVHHEIYDITEDARHLLLCVRSTEGSKYGVRTTSKDYYILSTHGRGVRVHPASKAKAAKAAKQAVATLGQAIAVCLGKKKLAVAPLEPITGYKIVAVADDFVSVFDQTPWTIGVTRREGATANHTGGHYVFPDLAAALAAWDARLVFADEWMTAARYSLLKCECAGRRFTFDNKKICITTVRPIEEVAALLL